VGVLGNGLQVPSRPANGSGEALLARPVGSGAKLRENVVLVHFGARKNN